MSEQNVNVLTFPERPDEYITYGGNFSSRGWTFGLPNDPYTCGAMPFRKGAGLASPNCPRGEDWVFMAEWASTRFQIPDPAAFEPAKYLFGPYDVLYDYPSRSQLTNMYHNLDALKTVWGSDFSLSDQQVSYDDVDDVLLGSLDMSYQLTSQQPPSGVLQLESSRVRNFFTDMAKMKCTFGSASHDSGGMMHKQLYFWSQIDGYDPTEDEDSIASLELINVPTNSVSQRPMQYDVQFVGLFWMNKYLESEPGTGTNDTWYCLQKLGSKTTVTQDMEAQIGSEFVIPCSYGGKGFAGSIAGLAGKNLNFDVPPGGMVSYRMSLDYLYVVVWPKYLQLPDGD